MANKIKYRTLNKELDSETRKFQAWVMRDYDPSYRMLNGLVSQYAKKYGYMELRDFAIKNDIIYLLK